MNVKKLTDGLTILDWLKCIYCGISIIAMPFIADAPLWLIGIGFLNVALAVKVVNTVKFPEDDNI